MQTFPSWGKQISLIQDSKVELLFPNLEIIAASYCVDIFLLIIPFIIIFCFIFFNACVYILKNILEVGKLSDQPLQRKDLYNKVLPPYMPYLARIIEVLMDHHVLQATPKYSFPLSNLQQNKY